MIDEYKINLNKVISGWITTKDDPRSNNFIIYSDVREDYPFKFGFDFDISKQTRKELIKLIEGELK